MDPTKSRDPPAPAGARRAVALAAVQATAPLLGAAVPPALAAGAYASGVLLLLLGSAAVQRRAAVLGLDLELSAFGLSVLGTTLLVLGRGLQRRVQSAWTLALLSLGAATALLVDSGRPGWALMPALLCLLLVPARPCFHRRAGLLEHRPRRLPFLVATVLLGLALWGRGWLGRHPEAAGLSWMRLVTAGPTSHGSRLGVALIGAAYLVGLALLLRPRRPSPALPGPGDLDRAQAILERHGRADSNLALSGDKAFLFGDSGESLLAYGVTGRTFVALGDPVGPRDEWPDLTWRLRELADAHGGVAVFYQVRPENLELYLELGLGLHKLGEEARISLADFSLEGKKRRESRRVQKKLEEEGVSFRVHPREEVAALLPELARVSEAWMASKRAREKGFSLGTFDPEYLRRLPVAAVRDAGGRVVAFANVLPGSSGQELTMDLMRYPADAPAGVMDYLITRIMLWGQAEGFAWFSLGMAPLSGLADRHLAPAWNRLGALLFEHGEPFYNFQGLRRFKQRFQPTWRPRYLAAPGGMRLAVIVSRIAALCAGGVRGVVGK